MPDAPRVPSPAPPAPLRTTLSARDVPPAVLELLRALAGGGFDAALVGGCVRDLLRGAPAVDFDVATAAPPEAVLLLFPRAVPIGLRHGTVMVPTRTGPVDVTSFRAGPRLEDDLGRRDFTVNAMAWRPDDGALVDPFGGRADLAAGRLRAVGDAAARLAEDPLRALRAARLVATLGLAPDPRLEAALSGVRAALPAVARERIRQELARLLVAPHAGAGLALLRRSGIEAELVPDSAPDASALLDRLPASLPLRLAAWLRAPAGEPAGRSGARAARAESALARLRFPRRVAQHVAALVRAHPIERDVDPRSDASVRRLLRRIGAEDAAGLLALREAELTLADSGSPGATTDRQLVGELHAALARVRAAGETALQRLDLALDGRAVMAALGRGPGPHVGEALRYLTERVIDDPESNTPERLRALLQERAAGGERRSGPAAR
jgi:tRNA nucleotidyltransferase (CCA-adding enzyme)